MVRPEQVIEYCQTISRFSERPGNITRTFLSQPMTEVHRVLGGWMERIGMSVTVDAVGNLRGTYAGSGGDSARLLMGSHLDTVPGAGSYDGVLGVALAIALVESLKGRRLPYGLEIVGFSEEEGVRFGVPFLGSMALVGRLDRALLGKKDEHGISLAQAIVNFGLDPAGIPAAALRGHVLGFLEFHIEQGPVLDSLRLPLGIVEGISGQSRVIAVFRGQANHAGTTPMNLRKDALVGAAEWILAVEREGQSVAGLTATVGHVQAVPGASNVIAGEARVSLDVRHIEDEKRLQSVERMIAAGEDIARQRGLDFAVETDSDHAAVPCDPSLVAELEKAAAKAGFSAHRMPSGAGHDAMILAEKYPVAILFLRSPRGISHHPDESVLCEDVGAALETGLRFFDGLAALRG